MIVRDVVLVVVQLLHGFTHECFDGLLGNWVILVSVDINITSLFSSMYHMLRKICSLRLRACLAF